MEENIKLTKYDIIQEKLDNLENRVQLLEVIAKKQLTELEPLVDEVKKVIQINAKGKTYFCTTSQEQYIFSQNNPGVETETFNIELPVSLANEYLNKPENKEQFTKKE